MFVVAVTSIYSTIYVVNVSLVIETFGLNHCYSCDFVTSRGLTVQSKYCLQSMLKSYFKPAVSNRISSLATFVARGMPK